MPSLIPNVINVTAADDGTFYLSNDPFFSSVSLLTHFDGDTTDSSKYHNTMTSGLATTATTPKFGAGSLRQGGTVSPGPVCSTPVVQNGPLDLLSGTADFTIDGWFWHDTGVAGSMTILDLMGDGTTFSDTFNIYLQSFSTNGTNLGVSLTTSIVNPLSSQVWKNASNTVAASGALGAWHHFAIVRSAGVPLLFVDGVSQTIAGGSNWINYTYPPGTFAAKVSMGNTGSVSGGAATGKIDEVRITKGVARWTANFTPPTAAVDSIPVHRGYNDGTLDLTVPAFGSTSPAPPLLDTDSMSYCQDYVTGTFAAPVYHFQVAIAGTQAGVSNQMFQDDLTSVSFVDKDGVQQTLLSTTATFDGSSGKYGVWTWATNKLLFGRATTFPVTFVFEDPNVDFNCDCETVSPYDTLVNVRQKMMVRLGYPNQLANPPPGMATLIDQYLRDAQDTLYRQLQTAALRVERYFRWTMKPGQRYYSITASEGNCSAVLDPYKITWVGFEDLNKAWYRLDEGIPAEYYTRANINFGWPTRFEIRSCIEIFPAPSAPYTLWIKGDFGLGPLTADTDRFTIDDKMVYLLALGNMKLDRGAKDAQAVLTQASNMVKSMVAGSHGVKRYVPRSAIPNPLTPPKFLPLGNEPA